MGIRAQYFDGLTSQPQSATLYVGVQGEIMLDVSGHTRVFPWKALRHLPRVGSAPHCIQFPDQSQCEIIDTDEFEAELNRRNLGRPAAWLVHLESKTRYVLFGLALTAVAAWGFIFYGIPIAAKYVASVLPNEIERKLGGDTLEQFDKWILTPSRLPAARQAEVLALFGTLQAHVPDTSHYQLVLRNSKSIGANAFALPNGIIIVTDDLIKLTDDAELTAVLAHEVGHVKFHHSLRHTLQSSATALLLATWLGDLTSLSSLAAAIPALLVNAQYSQSFELEADRYALDYLAANGLSPESFASALSKLEQSHFNKHDPHDSTTQSTPDSESNSKQDFLSTHPATADRIKLIRQFNSTRGP